jgi:hypothetical protein
MPYTTINKGSSYFNTVLYTGTGSGGSNRQITGVGFQPDWVWVKTRGSTQEHVLSDVVRGATGALDSSATTAEEITNTRIGAFISDGFQLGSGAVQNRVNENGVGLVSWNWLANGAGVSNTSGTITSTVSANTTAGFSIVSYTGTGANATVGHGLGVAPNVVIIKERTSAGEWVFGDSSLGFTKFIEMNSSGASQTNSTRFNNTAPTSSVFSIGTALDVNTNGNAHIAYCFADVKGFSKFGSYTGNGSTNGTFIYTGFSPAFVMFKNTTTANRQWYMMDNKRNTFNVANIVLAANQANDESWWGTGNNIDFLSNGIKIRSNSDINNSSDNFIYMTFAQNPFVSSTQIPVTAR